MPSPPHPRLRNRHSLPRAVSNGAHPSDYAARELWTAIPCESLEYRGVVPTSESSTNRPQPGSAQLGRAGTPKHGLVGLPELKQQGAELFAGRLRLHASADC